MRFGRPGGKFLGGSHGGQGPRPGSGESSGGDYRELWAVPKALWRFQLPVRSGKVAGGFGRVLGRKY